MSQVITEVKQEQERSADLSAERQARAMVYNFLSSLFAKEVTTDLVAQLTSAQGQSFLNSLALEPSLSGSINNINTKLAELNNEESLLKLAADFCGLFLVDGKTCASPYAGQYLSACHSSEVISGAGGKRKKDKIQIFGELHQQMSEFLTKSELQVHSDFPEPGDHIAVILAYIAHLCVTAESTEQLNFINRYLLTWLSDFNNQVNKYDRGLFYCALSELTLEWVQIELEYLTEANSCSNG
jgi:TorA-specific chaperone